MLFVVFPLIAKKKLLQISQKKIPLIERKNSIDRKIKTLFDRKKLFLIVNNNSIHHEKFIVKILIIGEIFDRKKKSLLKSSKDKEPGEIWFIKNFKCPGSHLMK